MALIGTISGSNGTSTTAISGSVIIADRPPGEFPSLPQNAKFYVSGTRDVNGPLGAIAIFGGDIFVTGGLGVSDYVQMLPVNELQIPTNTSASYIYTSGSTNDMYFTQYNGPYTNTTRLRWLESSLSSGLLHGGILSTQNGTTTFSITSGSGLIVYQNATTSSDPYPTIRFVKWPAYVSQSLQYSGSAQITYVAIDPDGDIDQSPIAFNTEQFKDRIVLGRILHQSGSVSNGATNTPTTAYAVSQNTNDFVRAFGPLKISGHFLSASGSAPTMSIIKTAGSSYVEGGNYSVDPNNPNIVNANTDLDVTVSKIYREYVSGSTPIIDTGIANAGYTVLDPSLYNNNGTLAAVGNSEYSIQRVFWFPRAVNQAIFVYYGSAKYSTMDEAIAGIGTENFIEGDNTAGSAILVGYICLKGNASDLLTTSQARVYQGGLFRGSAGASFGGAGGGASLPGGLDTHVQFNDDNAFGGESGFTFNKLTNSATLVGDINAANANLSGNVNAAVASITGNAYTSGTLYAKDVSIFGNLTVTSGSTIISGSGDVSIQSGTGSINIGTDNVNVPPGSETVQIPSASNNTFSQPNGTLTSPAWPSTYPASADGYTVFSGIPGVYRTISGVIQTEISFDTVRVYNGSGTGGTLLYTQSGLFANFSFTSSENQTFTVRFTSDSTTQQAGFALTVTGIYAKNISIGGGTSSKTIRIGNISNSFPLILSGGTGGITLTTDAVAGNIDITNTSTGVLNLFNDTGTGAVNIVGSSATGARSINIGTGGTGAKTVTVGNNTVVGSTTTIDGGTTGGVNIATAAVATPVNIANNTTAGTVNMGTGTATQTLNLGSGSGAKTVNVGSSTGASSLSLQAGTGVLSIGTAATNKAINIGNATNTSLMQINLGSGGLTISSNATAGIISICNDNGTGAVAIGNGTATRALNIGTGLGDGQLNLGTGAAVGRPVTVGSSTGTSSLSLQAGTGALNIGTAVTNKVITIGQTANTSNLALNGGTGGITLTTTSTGTIQVGNDTGTGTVSIGSSTGARQIDIGNGATSTGNVNIVGSGATGARTVDLGTGGTGQKIVRIGNSSVAGSTTTIAAGTTGGVNIGTAAVATPVNIATNTTAGTTSIGTGTATQTVDVNTGAGVKTTTVGSTNTTSTTTINGGTNGVNIATAAVAAPVNIANNTTAGTVNVGTGSATQTLNFGTGAGIKTVSIGSTNSSSTLSLNAGSGAMTFTAGDGFDVNATTAVTIDSSGGSISIGSDSVSQTINLGTAGNRSINIGSFSSTGGIDLRGGFRGVLLGIGATQGTRGIGYFSYNRSGGAYTDGTLLAFQASPTADDAQPQFVLASAASGSLSSIKWVNGISCHNASVANDGQGGACTVAGTITPVKFETGGDPAGPADIGKRVYLSPVVGQEGKATLLQPSGSGVRLFQVGILARGVADANSNWFVQFVPQFIEDIP